MALYNWLGVTGDWTEATDWLPNGVPTALDTAAILIPGAYTVGVFDPAETVAAAALDLNDADATLEIDGTLTVGGIFSLEAGTVALNGTLADATVFNSGGTFNYNFGTFSHVTYNATLNLGDSGVLLVAGGLTVNDTTGTGPGEIDVTGAGSALLAITDSETLDNVTINVGSDVGFDAFNANGDSLELAAGVVLNSVGLNGLSLGGIANVTNLGMINAGVAGGSAFISVTGFDNAGALNITGGQTLTISSSTFGNTGTVLVDVGSELDIQNSVIAATQASGGTVDIEGVLSLNGDTIDLGATSAFAHTTLGGTLSNAVILSDGGLINYSFGTLVAATVDGVLDLGDSGALLIAGGLTVNDAAGTGPGEIDVTGAGSALLAITDSETLDNVTINVGSDVGFDAFNANGDSLELGAGVVLNSVGLNGLSLGGVANVTNLGTINAGVAGGSAFISVTGFDNAGALNVTGGQTLTISSSTFGNTGTVLVDVGSELDIQNSVIAATQASGGTVDIEGVLSLNGDTIDLGATSAFAHTTLGGTLSNAVILSDGGLINYSFGTLVAATVDGVLDLGDSGALLIAGGLTVNDTTGTGPGEIDVTGAGSALLAITDSETLDNVTINVGSDVGFDAFNANGDSLELGAGVVLNSVGLNGLSLGGIANVTNLGMINAGVAGGSAFISVTGFDNAGALNITGGQTLTISSSTFGNTGTVLVDVGSELDIQNSVIAATQASGGTVDIEGVLSLNGDTIDLGATSAFAHTTLGGTLSNAVILSDGGLINYSFGTLVAATVDGVLDLGDSGVLLIAGGLTVNNAAGTGPGEIDVTGSGASTLAITDNETLDNVTINVGSNVGFDFFNANSDSLVLGAGVVLNSVGTHGLSFGGTANVTNLGHINAGASGGFATIDVGGFTNAGTIAVTNRQTVSVTSEDGTLVNTGLITVSGGGSSLEITSAVSGVGKMTVGSGSTLELGGAVSAGQDISLKGNLVTVVLDDPAKVAAKFHGFSSGDVIDLVTYSPFDTVKTVGAKAVIKQGSETATLDFTKIGANQAFGLLYDGATGADLIIGTVIKGPAGGHATISGGSTSAIITAFGKGNTINVLTCDSVVNAGSGEATVKIGNDSATVTLSGSSNKVTGGNGHNFVKGFASHSSVKFGSGNNLVALAGSYDTVSVGSGANVIGLIGSHEMVTVGSGSNVIGVSGSSDVIMIGGGTSNVSIGGTHNAVFLGKSSSTIADFTNGLNVAVGVGGGRSVLTNVAADPHFVLDLTGGVGGYHSAAQAFAALQSDGAGGSLLALGTTGSIDFAGVAPNQLTVHNFAVVSSYHFG